MANETLDEKYIHARGLMKSVDFMIRNELKNDSMLYGGPTDFMRQLDDLNLLADAMVHQIRNLAWQLEFRVKAKLQQPTPTETKEGTP